jgi:hypothetical protein
MYVLELNIACCAACESGCRVLRGCNEDLQVEGGVSLVEGKLDRYHHLLNIVRGETVLLAQIIYLIKEET